MAAGTITLKVPRHGLVEGKSKVHAAAAGFQGEVCLTKTSELLTSLGTAENLQPTQEMYETPEKVHVTEEE